MLIVATHHRLSRWRVRVRPIIPMAIFTSSQIAKVPVITNPAGPGIAA